jgi:hypothetical protein
MKLSIGDKLNDDPGDDDIVGAIDAKPQGAGWHIKLQSNGDDFIEATAGQDGRYRLSFMERGRRFNAAGPVDAETLKTILVEYLSDDSDWRDECGFIPDGPRGSRAKASRRISSKPPPWAVILIATAFSGTPIVFFFSESFGIVWLIAGPMVVMGLAMLANKMLQARRASIWPQAAGRITRSEVAATHRQTSGGPTEVINVPAIEYEFSANGSKIIGTRISIGEDTGGANTEATLAHYPVGAAVMVYYDPDDPGNCVLEREIPKDVPKGCVAILAILAAVGIGGYWLVVHFMGVIAPYVQDGRGRFVVAATIAGLVSLMLFLGSRFGAKAGSDWPVVTGKVVESGTESYRARVNRTTVTSYAPLVEYSYPVNGHEYRCRQIQLEGVVGGDSRADAAAVAARYPKGSNVEVHYDPTNPGNAALEKPTGVAWYLLAIAVTCFGAAIYASGLLRW